MDFSARKKLISHTEGCQKGFAKVENNLRDLKGFRQKPNVPLETGWMGDRSRRPF